MKAFKNRLSTMYRVYVLKKRKRGSEIIKETKTNTPNAEAAKIAFLDLRNNADFFGKNYILLMTHESKKLNVHLFNTQPGEVDYFDENQEVVLQ